MKILVIDNYDSFVYNLVHYLEELDCEVTVIRNDRFHIDEVEERVRNILLQQDGQRIKLGFDYVVIAELLK